jgi:hypothetical protein
VAPSHRDLWPELNEDHAVAFSHHDATLTGGNIEHHISGRNQSLLVPRRSDGQAAPGPAAFTGAKAAPPAWAALFLRIVALEGSR